MNFYNTLLLFCSFFFLSSCLNEQEKFIKETQAQIDTTFVEDNSLFNDREGNSREPDKELLNKVEFENSTIVVKDYNAFFNLLLVLNSLSNEEFLAFEAEHLFKSKYTLALDNIKEEAEAKENELYAFYGYYRALNQQGAVKIGEEIHIYREDRMVNIRDGQFDKVDKATTLSATDSSSNIYVSLYAPPSPVFGCINIDDLPHVASAVINLTSVQVASPYPASSAYNYDFVISGNSLQGNTPIFPAMQAFHYFRIFVRYQDYLGVTTRIDSYPYTQQALLNNAISPPTTFVIPAITGQAIVPIGSGFNGDLCAQVGYWEKYPGNGSVVGTGGSYELKCLFNGCDTF